MAKPQLEDLYRRAAGLVLRRCLRWLGDWAEADDMVQEVFLRAYRYNSQDKPGSELGWLYRIADRVCIDSLRRRKRWSDQTGPLASMLVTSLGGRNIDSSSGLLKRVLQRCPPNAIEVGFLAYMDALSQDDIAAHLNISRRTVNNRLEVFRNTLFKELGALEVNE